MFLVSSLLSNIYFCRIEDIDIDIDISIDSYARIHIAVFSYGISFSRLLFIYLALPPYCSELFKEFPQIFFTVLTSKKRIMAKNNRVTNQLKNFTQKGEVN